MAGPWGQHLQDNLNIDNKICPVMNNLIIHNFANPLYSNMNRSCFGHPSCMGSEPG